MRQKGTLGHHYPREQCIQTVHFLLFINKGIVLSNTSKGKLFHQVNLIRMSQMLVLTTVSSVHILQLLRARIDYSP